MRKSPLAVLLALIKLKSVDLFGLAAFYLETPKQPGSSRLMSWTVIYSTPKLRFSPLPHVWLRLKATDELKGAKIREHLSDEPQMKKKSEKASKPLLEIFIQTMFHHPSIRPNIFDGVWIRSLRHEKLLSKGFSDGWKGSQVNTKTDAMRSFIHDCQCVMMMISKHFGRYNKSHDKHSDSRWNAQVNKKSGFMINRFLAFRDVEWWTVGVRVVIGKISSTHSIQMSMLWYHWK